MPGYVPDLSEQMDQDPSAINLSDPYAAMRRKIAMQAVQGDTGYNDQVAAESSKFDQRASRLQAAQRAMGSNATGYDTGPTTATDVTDRAALKRQPVRIGSPGFASQLDPRIRAQIAEETLADPTAQKAPITGSFGGKDFTMDVAPSVSNAAAQAMNQRMLEAARLRADSENKSGERNYNLELKRREQEHADAMQRQQWAHENDLFERANPASMRIDQMALAHTNSVNAEDEANFKAKNGMSRAEMQQARMSAVNGLLPQLAARGQAGAAAAAGLYQDLPGFDQPGMQQALNQLSKPPPGQAGAEAMAHLSDPSVAPAVNALLDKIKSHTGILGSGLGATYTDEERARDQQEKERILSEAGLTGMSEEGKAALRQVLEGRVRQAESSTGAATSYSESAKNFLPMFGAPGIALRAALPSIQRR